MPTESATPAPTPTSPERQIRIVGLGLDGRDVGVERYVLFGVDGLGTIRAQVENSTGRSQICLWRGNNVNARTCQTGRDPELVVPVVQEGHSNWTLSLIGANTDSGPVVDLTLTWHGDAGEVTFENLRYEGQPRVNYNGVALAVTALAEGNVQVAGRFEGQQQHMYRVVVERLGPDGGVLIDETGGPANEFEVAAAVTPGVPYSHAVTVSNPNEQQEPGPVFVEVVVIWP